MTKRSINSFFLLTGFLLMFASCRKETASPAEYRPNYGVPSITIVTDGKVEVATKEDHIPCTVKFFKTGATTPDFTAAAKIHIRGNATANYPKKPYKIKFEEKQSPCGFPANKDWVLLAMYCDNSLLREAYLHKIASKAGLPYQIRYEYVMVKLNGEDLGLYLLTDSVEKSKDRIDIDDSGFIVEKDYYYYEEPLYISSVRAHAFTFKYPDASKGDITQGDDSFNYIKNFIDNFELATYRLNFDEETGYRKYIEARSWAKWFLVQEITGNIDPNLYYVLKDRSSKLEAGPVWDAEWSLGLAAYGSSGWVLPPATPLVEGSYWADATYYRQFLQDPCFIGILKEEWEQLKPQMESVREEMESLAKSLTLAQAQNFKIWPITDTKNDYMLVHLNDWTKECSYADDFLVKHMAWFDGWLANK